MIDATGRSDAELWGRVIANEISAFEKVVEKYQGAVVAVAFSQCGDFSASQDIAQETFLAAWSSREQLREPEKLLGWLCSISRKLAAGVCRSRAQRHAVAMSDAADPFDPMEQPIDSIISREEEELVWNAIAELPEAYREPLVLFYQESRSVHQIAQSLDISNDTAKQRLSRGREMLRSSLAETVEGILVRARPGKALTLRIMAALAGFSAAGSAMSSKAIASSVASSIASTVAGKAIVGVAGGASAGMLGGMLGAGGGLLGAYVGTKMPALAAHTMTERRLLEKSGRGLMAMSIAYTILVVLLSLGIASQVISFSIFWVLFGVLQVVFFATIFSVTIAIQRKATQIRKTVREEDDPNPSPMRAWVKRLEKRYRGRSYQSKSRFLGIPWIDIQVSDSQYSSNGEDLPTRKTARGWIAIGDRANGILIGAGGIARGLVAIGGLAYGVIAFGGLAVGLLGIGGAGIGLIAIGGGAIGYQAIGGGAIGYDACGGAALGWHSAAGGGAIARHAACGGGAFAIDFAVGGGGSAASFNTAEAKEVVQAETYLWLLEYQQENPLGIFFVIVVGTFAYSMLIFAMMKLMYVRVDSEVAGLARDQSLRV